jgi:hypothetical protein
MGEPRVPSIENLLILADRWIDRYWNADHLRRTVEWVRRLGHDPSGPLLLAALTHDMERAFPGPDMPEQDARRQIPDPEYDRMHQDRSARIVGTWLREQAAGDAVVAAIGALVRVHEEGGWPEADLLQAADSLSFLETNVDLFIDFVRTGRHHYTAEAARGRMRYMHARIRLPRAREIAEPLRDAAIRRIDASVLHQGAAATKDRTGPERG